MKIVTAKIKKRNTPSHTEGHSVSHAAREIRWAKEAGRAIASDLSNGKGILEPFIVES